MFFLNISNESHQTQLDQKEYKPIKTGGFIESVGWAHHNPPLSIHLGSSRRHLFTLSRFAVVAGFGRNAEDEHVAERAVPAPEQHRRQRRTGASFGRRPGWWGRSTGAPRQLEDRLPRLGCGHSEAFLGCLEFESFDFDFDFGWIFWSNVWSLIFCWVVFSCVAQFLSCCVSGHFVVLRLFECAALKWDRPIDPETPARG